MSTTAVTDAGVRSPEDDPAAPSRWLVGRWVGTRVLCLLLFLPETFETFGDVKYYFESVTSLLGAGGLGDTLHEYPTGAIPVFLLPRLVTGAHELTYVWTFIALMLLVDALFTTALWRVGGRRRTPGLSLWLWFAPALGPLVFTRLDLVAAVLGGAAMLVLLRRPALSGVLLAAGAAVKLWPVALLPSFWLRRPGRLQLLAGFMLAGAVLVAAMVGVGGFDRLASPLTWQSDRSLQLESYLALPLLLGSIFSGAWHSEYTSFKAFELFGPGVQVMLHLATVVTGLAVVVLAVIWVRAVLAGRSAPPAAIGFLGLGTACLVVISDKTFSPQYLMWLGALLAATGVVAADEELARANRLMLGICVLTQLVYPALYSWLINLNPIAVLLVLARDIALAVLAYRALHRAWQLTGRPA